MPSARDIPARDIIPVLLFLCGSQDPKTVHKGLFGLIYCIRNVTNARSTIANAGGVTHTLSAMRRFPTEPKIQACGCALVHTLLLETGEATKRAVVEQGGVPLVVAVLERFSNDETCRKQAIFALYVLASLDASAVVNAGAIPAMVTAVQRHPDDYVYRGTVWHATECWAQLSYSNSAHLQALMEAVPVIVCLLKQACESPQDVVPIQGGTSHPVAVSCLLTLGNVAKIGTNACSLIASERGVEATITAMRLRRHSVSIQSTACALLTMLLVDNRQDVSQAIVETGGIPLVVKAMKLIALQDSRSMELTESSVMIGFTAMMGLVGDDCVTALQKAGVVPVLISVLKKHKGHAAIQLKAMMMLWNTVSTYRDIPKEVFGGVSCILGEVFHEGGHEAILAAMKRHCGNTEIQRAGCMLLAALSSEGDGNPTLVVAAGGIPLLEAAKESHVSDEEVQKFADMSLDSLKDVPRCHMCNKTSGKLKKCGRCKLTTYCSRDCQGRHWKSGHKAVCKGKEGS